MKAMLVKDKMLRLCEVADPTASDGEILIEIHAAAVNRADIFQRQGTYPSPAGWPQWPGLDVAGIVIGMGATAERESEFRLGDEVIALVGGGAYAEKIAAPYQQVLRKPRNLSFVEAASLPETFATAYLNLVIEGHLKSGQTVYIAAGASGLASAAIPMAKGLGATVVTDVLKPENIQKVSALGADYVVDLSRDKVSDLFAKLDRQGTPVNCAIDCLAGEELGACLQYMAEGGYWVVLSTLAGAETKLNVRALLSRSVHLMGSMLRKRSIAEKGALLKSLEREIFPLIENGSISPRIDRVLPLESANEAQDILLRGENVGKVVLRVR